MGCTNTPDRERIWDISNSEAILYDWFVHKTILAEVAFRPGCTARSTYPRIQQCSLSCPELAFGRKNEYVSVKIQHPSGCLY